MGSSRTRRSPSEIIKRFWRRLGRNPELPEDPFANMLVPLGHGFKDRSGSAAVADPKTVRLHLTCLDNNELAWGWFNFS